jgi:hypothetical protein
MACLRRVAALGVVAALILVGGLARAGIESDLVKQGVAAYNDLEYARAIDLLNKALHQETLTREEKIVTFQTLAYAHVALDRSEAAMVDFQNLLRVDGAFELDRTISPRVRAIFEEAKARVATGKGIDGGGGLPSVKMSVLPGRGVKEGQAVQLSAAHPGGLAHKVELFYRTRGQNVFGKLSAPVDARGRFVIIVPGMHVRAPALEYYVVVLDDSGASVAAAGRLGRPLAVDVAGLNQPVYKKGWFWGVLGGIALVGAGVATAVVLTTQNTVTSSTPATISIMPH